MNKEIKEALKIGLSCFIGAAAGLYIALQLQPQSWLLGILSGLATGFAFGYFSYQVKDVARAIPVAFKKSVGATGQALYRILVSGPLTIVLLLSAAFFCIMLKVERGTIGPIEIGGYFFIAILCFMALVVGWFLVVMIAEGSAIIKIDDDIDDLGLSMSWRQMFLTVCLSVLGLVKFFVFGLWKWLFTKAIPVTIKAVGTFFWALFVAIHSKQRLICGVDSALGCGVAYLFFAKPDMDFGPKAVTIIAGGLIGLALGILNWELVSKRWLKLHLPKPIQA